MPKNVLDKNRQTIFNQLAYFSRYGALAGGTALALQLKHRRSFDFDVLTSHSISPNLLPEVETYYPSAKSLLNTSDELTISVDETVKISFIHFPFPPRHRFVLGYPLPLWSTLDIAGNKAYAIGRRGTYRDYIDIFAILKSQISMQSILGNATLRFGDRFSERLFLQQLVYFDDLNDFTTDWLWRKQKPIQVKNYLENKITEYTSTQE